MPVSTSFVRKSFFASFLVVRVCIVSSLLTMTLFLLTLVSLQPARAERVSGRVLAVQDGDTLLVSINGAREKVIMFGVDCPENTQEFGPAARQFTSSCCFHKDINLDVRGKDKFGRVIASVSLSDGADLNKELVRRGLAWWSDKFAPDDTELRELQAAARTAKLGLWAAPNPIPPWIFRNGEKGVQATIVPSK